MNSITRLLCVFFILALGLALLKAPFLSTTIDAFCLLLANLTYFLVSPFDAKVELDGAIYFRQSFAYAIEVTRECSALGYTLVLVTVSFLYSDTWASRLKTAFVAVLFSQAINVIRLVVLLYGRYFLKPEHFDILHYYFLSFVLSASTMMFILVHMNKSLRLPMASREA